MTDGAQSRRPAEVQLIRQLKRERDALLDGFRSRSAVLKWGQRITVRTLGQIPQRRFEQLAKSFQPDDNAQEGPLLAAFLNQDSDDRTREIEADVAKNVRERWAAEVLGSVQVRAFRDLRKDAGEYVGESEQDDGAEEPGYDPDEQRAFVMRPALDELDEYQATALEMVVDGLEDRSQILDWGDVLTSATRGEAICPDRGAGAFIPKCYREPSTVRLLTDESPPWQRAREAFLALWILPAFNRGVRDLAGRTAEEPDEQTEGHGPGEVA